ncbi:hypothetical protein H4W33_002802 [Kibdelosporangium phytohabitans]|nr:hypothetical protein [Kibdelosporangium phytohabitans]
MPDSLEEGDLADIRRELAADDEVRAAIEELWPLLTPQTLLSDLYADPDRLEVAFPDLREDERALLLRSPRLGWTAADAPLLDEAAELQGVDDRLARAQADQRRRDEQDYTQGVLDILQLEDEADPDILTAYDLIDASRLAERNDEEDHRTAAERAAADRDWTFGHVIVDEAQALSAMAWCDPDTTNLLTANLNHRRHHAATYGITLTPNAFLFSSTPDGSTCVARTLSANASADSPPGWESAPHCTNSATTTPPNSSSPASTSAPSPADSATPTPP